MTFIDDFKNELDQFGLPKGTGNPWVELAVAYQLGCELGQANEISILIYDSTKVLDHGGGIIFKKLNPDGTPNPDQVTHDDTKAYVSIGDTRVRSLLLLSKMERWFGQLFYSGLWVRPWDAALYRFLAGRARFYDIALIKSAILADAYTDMDSASNKQLMWLITNRLETYLCFTDTVGTWRSRIKAKGGMHRYFTDYYKGRNPNHPFITYSEGM